MSQFPNIYIPLSRDHDSQLISEWVSSVLRPHQHSIGYTGDGFYRSEDPTNSIKVLREKAVKGKTQKREITHMQTYSIHK